MIFEAINAARCINHVLIQLVSTLYNPSRENVFNLCGSQRLD